MNRDDIEFLTETCQIAGEEILEVYAGEFDVSHKADKSPVTEADMRAHRVIVRRLREHWPEAPVLSEESSAKASWEVRRTWRRFWLVDPLDGTKEFVKRNGQFTVNIALIENRRPVAGWVYAPVTERLYWAAGGEWHGPAPKTAPERGVLRVVGSLSHSSPEMEQWLAREKQRHGRVEFVPMGSSLKICLVAAGEADVYPRLGPTMEWDTAAAHAVANAAGRKVCRWGTEEELKYNKEDLHNPWFVVR